MTQKEFEEQWLPAIRLLARSEVYLKQLLDRSEPITELVNELLTDIENFVKICPKVN